MKTLPLRTTGRFQLAATIALADADAAWVVVGAAEPEAEAALLAAELSALLDVDVRVVHVPRTEALAALSRANAEPVVFVASKLRAPSLDEQRERLRRTHAATLVVPMEVLDRLFTEAPHFTSWIGTRLHVVEEDRFLEEAAREERLAALRAHHAMSDDEFVRRVEARELATNEPDLLEWLVLLGRDDLAGLAR